MRPQTRTHRIAALAGRQHGHVTADQLRAAGYSVGQIKREVSSGHLLPRHRCVYAVGHVPRTRESRWQAAVLALGDGAVLSHRAAAAHHGLITSAVPTEVIAAGRLRHRDGLVVHHTRLAAEHVMTLQGIRVTTVLRTMLDLATVLTQRGLERAFEEAQVLSGLLPAAVAAEVMMRTGHRGSRRLRAVLVGAVDPADVRSVLELRFLRMCAKHGLARPEVNKRLGRWRPDFFWPAARVVVETDSWRHHRTAAKRLQDARKDASLCEMGLRVIRLRWVDVAEHPRTTADVLRQALSSS